MDVQLPTYRKVLFAAWLLVFGGAMTVVIASLGWSGVGVLLASLTVTALWLGAFISVLIGRNKRRNAQVAATHPGWAVTSAVTTPAQAELLRAAGGRARREAAVTLAYGPGGIELWARHRNGSLVPVLQMPWADVVDIRALPGMPFGRDARTTGLRITLADGSHQDMRAIATSGLRKVADRAGTSAVAVLAADIEAHRPPASTRH